MSIQFLSLCYVLIIPFCLSFCGPNVATFSNGARDSAFGLIEMAASSGSLGGVAVDPSTLSLEEPTLGKG